MGTVRLLTNDSGNVVNRYLYDAYGNILNQAEVQQNSYKFTGEQFDPELNSYYQRARYYNPSTGRFISRDSFEGFLERPLSQNNYSYGEGNPANRTDPTGLIALLEYGIRVAEIKGVQVDVNGEFGVNTPSAVAVSGATIGLLQGFGATNIIFIGEVLGLVNQNASFSEDFFQIALERTKTKVGEIKDNLNKINEFNNGGGLVGGFINGVSVDAYGEIKAVIQLGKALSITVQPSLPSINLLEGGGFNEGSDFGIEYIKSVLGLA